MSNSLHSFKLPLPFLALACLCSSLTKGQSAGNDPKETTVQKFYSQVALGATTQHGFDYNLGVQAVFKHNWTASVSYQHISVDPKGIPADYERGYTLVLIIPIYDPMPDANMNIISFTGGRLFPVSRKIWFGAEAGVSVVTGDKMTFTPQKVVYDFFTSTSNYAATPTHKTTVGGMLKADFNWAFSPYVGMGASAFANINSIQSPVGFELKFMFGWLNNKKPK